MTWHLGPLLAFDTETTGVDPHTVRIVQVGLALIQPESGAQQHLWLIDPGVDIPDSAAAVHGISTEKARADGERPRQSDREAALEYLTDQLGRPVTATKELTSDEAARLIDALADPPEPAGPAGEQEPVEDPDESAWPTTAQPADART